METRWWALVALFHGALCRQSYFVFYFIIARRTALAAPPAILDVLYLHPLDRLPIVYSSLFASFTLHRFFEYSWK